MGASQSTRRISFENDTDTAPVITLSNNVVERLKGGCEDEKKEDQGAGDTSEQEEIERELKANNDYWENRVSSLIESQERMNSVMQTEYCKALDEMEQMMPRAPVKGGKLPCQDNKSTVVKCYKMNSGQPLLCANEVAAFASCMTNMRIRLQEEGKLG